MTERVKELIVRDLEDLDYHLSKFYQTPPEERTESQENTISFFNGAKWALQQILRMIKEEEENQ